MSPAGIVKIDRSRAYDYRVIIYEHSTPRGVLGTVLSDRVIRISGTEPNGTASLT
jgi:hypothetical protein